MVFRTLRLASPVENTQDTVAKTTNILETLTEEQDKSSEVHVDEIIVDIMDIGGIVGRSSGKVVDSVNDGSVGYENTGYNVGGIVGRQSGKVEHCNNGGAVVGRKDVGGIVGQMEPYTKQEMTQADLSAVQSEVEVFTNLLNQTMEDMDTYSGDMYQALVNATQKNEDASRELEKLQEQLNQNGKAGETNADSTMDTITLDADGYINTLNQITQELYNASVNSSNKDTLQSDMTMLSNQVENIFGALSGSINHTLQELSSTENKVQDISRDHTMEVGIVTGCENRGTINGETNTGGITGIISIELTYDLDNTMGVSALITSSSKYLVYAVIDKCASYADISGKKECVGGIVGRMDYGAVKSGLAAGEIMCKTGDNTGKIAGLSAGTVENCDARVTLSGVNYVGGIVGDGQDVMNCYAYASLQRAEELYGAIAGISRGQVNNNYYVKNASKIGKVGAIDDISYEGKAQGLTYDEMAAREDVPDVFKTIEVTFMAHDEVIETRQVSFGEAVGELPKVTENDGDYWVWDSFDQEHIYYSMTIHGSYHKAITSLSTGEDVPKFLVEGSFNDTQHLQAIPVDSANADESYTLTVNDYEGTLKVRARGEQGGTLYVDNGSGIKEVKYQQDGSYHVFKMENRAIYQFVYGEESHIGIIIVILAAISLAGILGFVIIKKRRTL